MKLSLIFGTYNRLEMLQACVQSIRSNVGAYYSYEIIVAEGGSTDGSPHWLGQQADVRVVNGGLDGAVIAFNKAYEASTGDFVAVLNDDTEVLKIPQPPVFEEAVNRLNKDPKAGQLAFGFTRNGRSDPASVILYDVHIGKPYANLGVIKREVADKIIRITGGLWSPCYRTYGADTELSCWVHRLGYTVLPARDLVLYDKLATDALRTSNYGPEKSEKDGKTFWKRWPNPQMLLPRGPMPNVTERELEMLKEWEQDPTDLPADLSIFDLNKGPQA